jgi:hypothetical protein
MVLDLLLNSSQLFNFGPPNQTMRLYLGIRAIAFIYLCSYAYSASYAQSYRNELGAVADNDVYISYMQDRYYTNGLLLSLRHAMKERVAKVGDTLKYRYEKKILELEAGQKIYNPYSSNAADAGRQDRPFTAYLYAGAALNLFYKNEDVVMLKAHIGVMGPSALGRETQSAFHKLFKMHPVNGWEYQLKEEISLNMKVIYDRLIYRGTKGHFDLIGRSAVSLGNIQSGANAGLLLRFGYLNALYQSSSHNSRIRNTGSQDPANSDAASSRTKPEFFLFTRPQLNYVVYDATIQGPLLRHDKGPVTFASKKLVYSQQAGVDVAINRWSGKYMVTFLSKEVESLAKPSFYGSVILCYSF